MAKKQKSTPQSFRLHNEPSHPREEAAKQVLALAFFLIAVVLLTVAMRMG